MDQNTILQQVGQDWGNMRGPAMENLKQARELLAKLRLQRGDAPPSEKEKQVMALVEQLTGFCQQIEAQFIVVQKSIVETNRLGFEYNIKVLIQKLEGWHSFIKISKIIKRRKSNWFEIWIECACPWPHGSYWSCGARSGHDLFVKKTRKCWRNAHVTTDRWIYSL